MEEYRRHIPMNRPQGTWLKSILLLSSLAAGGLATLFVPPYRDIAYVINERKSATAQETHRPSSSDMSRVRTRDDASWTL